ncbi:MAG TPA: lipoate protein ligase C-terminal domain-containing protein [Candidatus Binataceae bacterium]|nr:lipoate protein ligase C-terminal domain-containing protein [Candidatus Binataceae bacterium]
MAQPEIICLPAVKPLELLGLQSHLLDTVKGGGTAPVLLIFQISGSVISLGRYHLYSGPASRCEISAYRRLTGGRIINPGAGWIGCALIAPSRTAMLDERDNKLRPERVMNRYTRGAMAALRALGVDCFYPGRDAITSSGRELAMCTFEEDAAGALLFELFIAVERGLETLPFEMERFDPDGALACRLYDAQTCTCLARELGRSPGFDELAGHLEAGYRSLLRGTRRRELTAAEAAAASAPVSKLARGLFGRQPDPSLSLTGRLGIQLGFIEAHLAPSEERIERIEFYGDFIANSAGLTRFEQSLAGQRLDLMTLTSVALQTYGDGSNFILGCGDLSNLARLILKAS